MKGELDARQPAAEPGLDSAMLASKLSPEDAMLLCAELDELTALHGNLARACNAEAYIATSDPADCEKIVQDCIGNGATVLGLELPVVCAVQPTELRGCDATVGAMLECAVKYGEFWSSRDCTEQSLTAVGPDCGDQLAKDCPLLYGDSTGDPGPTNPGGGSCAASGDDCAASDCCEGSSCVVDGANQVCAADCASGTECQSGCCAPLEGGGSVCSPQVFCASTLGSTVCADLELRGDDGEYLGVASSNEFAADSVCNEFSTYGSEFSSFSIFNEFGTYGSEFSALSAYNQFSTTPPFLYCATMDSVLNPVSKNQFLQGAIDPDRLCAALAINGY